MTMDEEVKSAEKEVEENDESPVFRVFSVDGENEREPQQITENIIDVFKLIREDGSEYQEGDLLGLDEDLRLELDWSLPDNHGYIEGDTFEFQLPRSEER